MKKYVIIAHVLILIVPLTVKALIVIPSTTVTIVKQTDTEEGSFSFNLSSPFTGSQTPTIQTQGNSGSATLTIDAFANTPYTLIEEIPPDWELDQVSCTSTSGSQTFSYIQDGVSFTPQAYIGITCTFVNSKLGTGITPVLIVPGVMGTDILSNDLKLWANLGKMLTDVNDDFMNLLQFNASLTPSDNSLVIGDLVKEPFPGQHYYDLLIQEFTSQGYVEGVDLFTFPYDWRYGASGLDENGTAVNIAALDAKIQDILTQTGADKVDAVAHSTGGLLIKKYVIDHPNDHHIGKAVFVGVPSTGAPKAIKVLLEGDSFGVPWLEDERMKVIGRNLPVLYDLAPTESYYAQKGSFYRLIEQKFLAPDIITDLDYVQAWGELVYSKNVANIEALAHAQNLHTPSFDNYDLRSAGVDLYSIVGCRAGTVGKIIERIDHDIFSDTDISFDSPMEVPGDGTVPLESATNLPIDADKKFYALKANHGKMPSQDGIRQKIVNIIAGASLATPDMTTDINQCKLKGKGFAIYSPLTIEIIDSAGNRLGMAEDGSVQNDIPNADFSIWKDHAFVYMPDEALPQAINIAGTGSGVFTLKVSDIEDNETGETQIFHNVPVTVALKGSVTFTGDEAHIALDIDGNGTTDQVREPDTALSPGESQDMISPDTELILEGSVGQQDYFRSSVEVIFNATDPEGDASGEEASGIFETRYKLDDLGWQAYDVNTPVAVTDAGVHMVTFYSRDRAGNNETEQAKTFTIDTVPPELMVSYSISTKGFVMTAVDDIDSDPQIQCTATSCTAIDQAGNVTSLVFATKKVGANDVVMLVSASYNGSRSFFPLNAFGVRAKIVRGEVEDIDQAAVIRGRPVATAQYDPKRDVTRVMSLVSNDRPVFESLPGMVMLTAVTNKGELTVSW